MPIDTCVYVCNTVSISIISEQAGDSEVCRDSVSVLLIFCLTNTPFPVFNRNFFLPPDAII
jgi:hypothetical protein